MVRVQHSETDPRKKKKTLEERRRWIPNTSVYNSSINKNRRCWRARRSCWTQRVFGTRTVRWRALFTPEESGRLKIVGGSRSSLPTIFSFDLREKLGSREEEARPKSLRGRKNSSERAGPSPARFCLCVLMAEE